MTTSIGRVILDIAADAAGFERDIQNVEKSARKEFRKISRELRFAQRDLDETRAKVRNLGLAIAAIGTGAIVGIARDFKRLADEADNLDKVRNVTGLTAEAIQELRFAAEQAAGVAGDQFDVAMQRFARRVGEAANGTGELLPIVQQLGIQLRNQDGTLRNQADLFNEFADAVAGAESEQEALRIAFKLFDSEGARLVGLMREGSQGVSELREQFARTGATISDEAVDASVRFNDSLQVLTAQAKAFGVSIFNDLIGPVSTYVDFLANTEEGQRLLGEALDDLAQAAKVVGIALGVGVTAALIKLIGQLIIAEVRVGRLTAAKLQLAGASRAAATGMAVFGRAVSIATGPIGIGLTVLGSLALSFVSIKSRAEEAIPGLRELENRVRSLQDTAARGFNPEEQRLRSLGVEQLEEELRRYEALLRNFARQGVDPASDAFTGLELKVEQLRAVLAGARARVQETTEAIGEQGEVADTTATSTRDYARELETLRAELAGPAARAALEFNRRQSEVAGALERGEVSLDTYNGLISAYAEEMRRALDPTEEINEALQRQIELQEDARAQFESVRQSLVDQLNVLTLTGGALYEYERAMFVAAQVAQLGENATAEYREEVARLAGELFDTANAAQTFAERVSEALSSILPENIAEGIGRGLEEGLTRGFNQISASDVLSGNFADIGNQLGQTLATSLGRSIGTSLGGPVGGAIGGLIGDIIGDLLFGGSVPKFQVRGRNATRATDEGTDLSVNGPLGQIDFAFRGIEAETRAAVERAFVQFDTAIASFITDTDQLTQIENALDQFGVSSRSDGEDIGGLLELRFDAILSTFDQVTQSVVRAAGQTLEEQVQALSDIQAIAIQQALGRGLGLDNALSIISELRVPGETLAGTFGRLRDAAMLLDTTMALTGATFGATREDVLRFGADFAAAFGGDLQRAGSLLSTIFGTFFTEAERLEVQVEQSTSRAVELLAQLGIDATDELLSRGGFRELFDTLSGVLSPADLAILVEAGAEIAALIQAEEQLAIARGDVADAAEDLADAEAELAAAAELAAERQRELSELLRDVGREALSVIAPARAEYAELADSIQANIVRARELGATEQQLDFIRAASEIRIRGFIASLAESIASLSNQLFGAGPQIEAIGGTLNVAANAAGNFRDAWLSAIENIQQALDSQLLGPNSTLTAQERQQESVSQFFAALSAAQGGDLSAAQSLPQLFQQALAQGASFFGTTTDDFAALEAQLRSALENADLPIPPDSPEVQTAQNTLATSQAIQQVEQTALQQLIAATQLIDQIGLLSQLTGDNPAEIGREFGIPIAELIGILTGEVPDLTGDALAQYFDELVAETNAQLDEFAQLESIGLSQVDLLTDIRDLLSTYEPPPGFAGPMPAFAEGGPVNFTGPALVHSGEFVVPRGGALVSGGVMSGSERLLEEIRAEIRAGNGQREVILGDQRRGLGAVATNTRELRDEIRKPRSSAKPALTRS